jgi:hypothetical protein
LGGRWRLFTCFAGGAICAIANDQIGSALPKLESGDVWLLRGEVDPDRLPADVVVIVRSKGYCLLTRDEIVQYRPGKAG